MDNFGSLQTDDQPLKLLRDVDGSIWELVVDKLVPDTEYTFQVSVVESAVDSLPAEASARTKVSIPPDMEAPSFHTRGNGKSTIDIELRRVRLQQGDVMGVAMAESWALDYFLDLNHTARGQQPKPVTACHVLALLVSS